MTDMVTATIIALSLYAGVYIVGGIVFVASIPASARRDILRLKGVRGFAMMFVFWPLLKSMDDVVENMQQPANSRYSEVDG